MKAIIPCLRFAILMLLILCFSTYLSVSQDIDTSMSSVFEMSLEELMDAKVTIATKSPQKISESPSVVSVITAEEIKNMGARQLEDVLQIIPGFELRKKYNGFYSLEIRGVKESRSSCRLLLLIDGIPLNEIFYGHSIRYGYLTPIDDIERIEIIRGPGSALYGRNAFSGVVNIITKKSKNKNDAYVKATIGNYGTKNIYAFYGYNNKKLNTSISLSSINTNDNSGDYTDQFGTKSKWEMNFENYAVNTKIGYGKWLLTGTYLNTSIGSDFYNSFAYNSNFNYSLQYNNQITSRFLLRSKIYVHKEHETQELEQYKPNFDIIIPIYKGGNGIIKISDLYPNGMYLSPQFKEYTHGFETDFNYSVSEKNNLLLGIQTDAHGVKDVTLKGNVQYIDNRFVAIPGAGENDQVIVEQGWFDNNKHDYFNIASYFQDIWYPTNNIGITLGGRYDYDSEYGSVFNPRVGFVWNMGNKTNLKLLYGRAYRSPSPSEQYTTNGYAIGNESLNPEIINTYELNFNWRNEKMAHSLNIYQNKLSNMIYAAARSSIDKMNIYKNIGKNTSTGIEYETRLNFNKHLHSFVNYSFTISENTDKNLGEEKIYKQKDFAPHKINMGVNYSFLKYFNFNLNLLYRSKMIKYEAIDFLSGQISEVKNNVGNYAVFNSTLYIDNLIKNINVTFSSFNLTNKKYYSQDTEHWYQPSQPCRSFYISIVFSF